jgi:serine/threonine-protein kinase RsbW
MAQTQWALEVPAELSRLRSLTELAIKAAKATGFDSMQCNRIELAVDEACTNIIEHAYRDSSGAIRLDIRAEPSRNIVITLTDTGKPFDPDISEPLDPEATVESLRIGGLGLHLIRQAMDDVHFEIGVFENGRRVNRLTMKKSV